MTKKVIVHEGLTTKHSDKDIYIKSYIGLEWDLPDEVDEATVARTMIRMRTLIRQELGAPDLAAAPQFNPEDLMKHAWKGKKDPDHEGEYKKGSLAWGWDFKDKFSEEVIKALEKGPVTIDKYEFSLNDTKTLVQTKKKK